MSSILTNNGAMVALQTMKSINANMSKTQSEISTGKSVATSRDNAAVWAISKTMEADVAGFKGIKDSLALGTSTVAVARSAAETVTGLLTQMKGKIVAAQSEGVDPAKIQTDITALTKQIQSVVGAAQFNGVNLVDGKSSTGLKVLASLDRSGSTVAASHIEVDRQNLGISAYAAKAAFSDGTVTTGNTIATTGDSFAMSLDASAGPNNASSVKIDSGAAWAAGDKVSMSIGGKTASYTVQASDVAAGNTPSDLIAAGMKSAIEGLGVSGLTVDYDSAKPGELAFTNNSTSSMSISGQFSNAGAGGLGKLTGLSVATPSSAATALTDIETMLKTSIDAAASFGSAQTRISIQSSFVGELSDSLKTGIGSMVDADMEETSARLQALQVQQQLGIQALSIANQQPQSILSLFR